MVDCLPINLFTGETGRSKIWLTVECRRPIIFLPNNEGAFQKTQNKAAHSRLYPSGLEQEKETLTLCRDHQ